MPPLNVKVELFADENEQPAGTVTRPMKRFEPALLSSTIEPVPDNVVVVLAVKLAAFRFKEPETVTAPLQVTVLVLVRLRVVVIETIFNVTADPPLILWEFVVNEIVPPPVKLNVVPSWSIPFLNSYVEVTAELKTPLALIVTSPSNRFAPVWLLSFSEPVEETVVAPFTVKFWLLI
jgi:hypothetical protein